MKLLTNQFQVLVLLILSIGVSSCTSISSGDKTKTFWVENPIPVIRTNETVVIAGDLLKKAFPDQEIKNISVKDIKLDKHLITQSIDYDQDGFIDEFVFQTNLDKNENKEFAIGLTNNDTTVQSLVYSAFVPTEEGMDDFTWENNYIGYRYYGQTRAEKQNTGVAIDIWCKRSPEFLTDKWYTSENSYHDDVGYGADHYKSGDNQGCGGSGIFINDSIYFSKAFSDWKIISNGPIRLVFELEFEGWAIDSTIIETKRITFDAGTYFSKIESRYNFKDNSPGFMHAVGVVQREESERKINNDEGWVASWEFLGENKGSLGTGFIASPDDIDHINFQDEHVFSFLNLKPDVGVSYYAGAAWSEFGDIHSSKDWEAFVEQRASSIHSPCIVKMDE